VNAESSAEQWRIVGRQRLERAQCQRSKLTESGRTSPEGKMIVSWSGLSEKDE
jgi:hypothetical protein